MEKEKSFSHAVVYPCHMENSFQMHVCSELIVRHTWKSVSQRRGSCSFTTLHYFRISLFLWRSCLLRRACNLVQKGNICRDEAIGFVIIVKPYSGELVLVRVKDMGLPRFRGQGMDCDAGNFSVRKRFRISAGANSFHVHAANGHIQLPGNIGDRTIQALVRMAAPYLSGRKT